MLQPEAGSVRVLIAEDHTLVREGTRQILEQGGLQVVGETERGDLALAEIERLQPDVALLDVRLPGLSGLQVAQRVSDSCPQVRVLILSAYDDEEYVLAALSAGCAGYLLKTVRSGELVQAIRSVHAGETVLPPAISRRLARYWVAGPRRQDASRARLSARELEVMERLSQGLANKEIARRLGISLRTVEGHLGSVFAKLGVGSRTEALVYALNHGLVETNSLEEGSR